MTSSHGDGTQAHYDRLAASYDQNWAYSPAYIAWMTRCILDRAAIQPGQVVADIGCGTGLYSRGWQQPPARSSAPTRRRPCSTSSPTTLPSYRYGPPRRTSPRAASRSPPSDWT